MQVYLKILHTLLSYTALISCMIHSHVFFTEMMNTDCMLDRDYQGWVDFGRRDVK